MSSHATAQSGLAGGDMGSMSGVARLGALVAGILGLLVVGAIGVGAAMSRARPETGRIGAEADAMVASVHTAVQLEAWEETGAVRWTFSGRNEHLWDRERGLSRVRMGDVEVLQRIDQRVGRVWRDGKEVHGAARARLIGAAWAAFINDSFWLQPFDNLNDAGVVRSAVDWQGENALFIEYGAGGVTPGDAYLWLLDDQGLPRAWHMWVSIIPIGGVYASWEGWQTLPTGARLATTHSFGPITTEITDLAGAATLAELEPGPDPFQRLLDWGQR